jgi:hypothetical protein
MGDAFPVNHKPVRTGFNILKNTTSADTSQRDTTNSKTENKMVSQSPLRCINPADSRCNSLPTPKPSSPTPSRFPRLPAAGFPSSTAPRTWDS